MRLTTSLLPRFVKIKVSVPRGSDKFTFESESQELSGFEPYCIGTKSSARNPKLIFCSE
ncbi:uncharacterized protein METZ01_LOCUS420206, partial [marine metagenome]